MNVEPCEMIKKRYDEAKDKKKFCGQAMAKCVPQKDGYYRHHWSYNRDHLIDVIYVQKELHISFHSCMYYDIREKLYRASWLNSYYQDKIDQIIKHGTLLDTKIKHIRFLVEVRRFYREKGWI